RERYTHYLSLYLFRLLLRKKVVIQYWIWRLTTSFFSRYLEKRFYSLMHLSLLFLLLGYTLLFEVHLHQYYSVHYHLLSDIPNLLLFLQTHNGAANVPRIPYLYNQ